MKNLISLLDKGVSFIRRLYRGMHPFGPFAVAFIAILVFISVYSVPSLYDKAVNEWRMKLTAMADDRKSTIELFIRERRSDSLVVSSYPVIRRIAAVSDAGASVGANDLAHADSLLSMTRTAYGYLSLHVVDSRCRPVINSSAGESLTPECFQLARDFFLRGGGTSVQFHRYGKDAVLAIIMPIYAPGNETSGRAACGALIAHVDPVNSLYMITGKQPFPTRTMETLLVRREGTRLVFLSPLRHVAAGPLLHSVPFDTPGLAGSHAAMGEERFGTFVDYRGTPVYAVTRLIADTDAGLVVKVDRLEALGDFFREIAYLAVAVLGLLASASGVGYAFMRRQRVAHLEAMSLRDARIRLLMEQANDIVLMVSPDGRIVDANRCAATSYGYARDELLSIGITDLRPPELRESLSGQIARALGRGLVYETEHLKKNGVRFPVEVSSSGAVLDEGRIVLMIIRDISERREAERRIIHSNRLYAVLSQSNQTIVRVGSTEELFERICRVAIEYGGFIMAWIGVVDYEAGELKAVAHHGLEKGYLSGIRVPLDSGKGFPGPSETCVKTGAPVVCNDISTDPGMERWKDAALERGYRSMGSFPIRSGGAVSHVLNVYSGETGFFTDGEVRLLSEIAEDISFAVESLDRREKKRVLETKLGETVKDLEALIRASPVAIIVTDLDGNVSLWNDAAERIFGWTADEVLGRYNPIVPEHMEEEVHNIRARIVAGELFANVETVRRTKSGAPVDVSFSSTLLTDAAGNPRAILATVSDISRRKRVEEELRDSEARFRLLIESAPDGIFVQTAHRFAFCNPATLRFLGAGSADALIGTPVAERFRPDFRDTVAERIRLLNEEKQPVPLIEEVMLRIDDTPFPAEVEAVPIDWRGEHGAMVFFRDITARRLVEIELRRNEEWLRLYFELPFIGMAVTSPQTKQWLRVNDRLCEILGYARDELVQKSWTDLTHPDDLEADVAEFEKVMRGESEGYKIDKRFIRGDGATIYATIDVKCVRTNRGEVDFFVATIQDITERKLADERIRASLLEKEVLLKEIHHRVKNNMQVIISLLSLQSRNIRDEDFRRVFNDSVTRIHSMALVHEKLYRSGNFASINFKEYLESLIDIISRSYSLDRGRITLTSLVPPVEWGVDTAIPCGLIVSEAITNAVKHAFPGDAKGEVRVSLSEEVPGDDGTPLYTLAISDTGVGFPEDVCFESAETLGMVLIGQLVQQLNGTVEILRDAGSTVRIRFPGETPEK
jgi:PAS domain S-box-containing protein